MNILIACEESQTECIEFRKKGHNAFSCDLQHCSGGHPEWHICADVLSILHGKGLPLPGINFFTDDLTFHHILHWDMIIAHPPCTFLSKAGACRLYHGGQIDFDRYQKGIDAVRFFYEFYNHPCEKICIENPVPMKIFELPHPSQYVEPWEFGERYSKQTCYWLKGLPHLHPTVYVQGHIDSWVMSFSSAKKRSKSFVGIAQAMADQWG